MFRKGEICQKVNRYLAKYLLEETYSLNLAVAVVKKTDSYAYDYHAIQEEMRRIKAAMPMTEPMGAMPFMAVDSITGYPLTSRVKGDYYCTEAKKKRDRFPRDESEKVFDNMVTEKERTPRWRYAMLTEIAWESGSVRRWNRRKSTKMPFPVCEIFRWKLRRFSARRLTR